MSKMSQEEFNDISKSAGIACCPNGEPHVYAEKLKWLDRKKQYMVGVCDNCGDVTYSWYWIDGRPSVIDKAGKVRP